MSMRDGWNLRPEEREDVALRLMELQIESPRQIEKRLFELGFRGQEKARRAGAVLAYNHYRRLWRLFVEEEAEDSLPAREYCLFAGASGSGKTFLGELLFQRILGLPSVTEDVTRFTEEGYVGDDVQTILTHLYHKAGRNRAWASCGVVLLDEMDKLAGGGEARNLDVSRVGVQRGLLALLSGCQTVFRTDPDPRMPSSRIVMPLGQMLWIGAGAFTGLHRLGSKRRSRNGMGFGAWNEPPRSKRIYGDLDDGLLEDTGLFMAYGMMPEMMGRFTRVVGFDPLSAAILMEILEDSVLPRFVAQFRGEGMELVVEAEAKEHIVQCALARETGARALAAALTPVLDAVMYEHFGQKGGDCARKVHVVCSDGCLRAMVESGRSAPVLLTQV